MIDPVKLAQHLVRIPSVTPDDGGCQELIASHLEELGFACERMPFGEVKNLWATRRRGGPMLVFAGHTDVVPPGPLEDWRHSPFEAVIDDGRLYGRGAADMKGSIACFIAATARLGSGCSLTRVMARSGRGKTRTLSRVRAARVPKLPHMSFGRS